MTPTQRSLDYLRKRGYIADVSEHWNSFAKIRKDLFGFIDIVAVSIGLVIKEAGVTIETPGLVGVQTTSYSNIGARVTKINGNQAFPFLKKAGMAIHVHGWRKNKNGRWEVKVVEL